MERREFEKAVEKAVSEYIASEESYDDNAQLRIDPVSLAVCVIDGNDSEEEEENPDMDYIDVMELVEMSANEGGRWNPDHEAIRLLADDYFNK